MWKPHVLKRKFYSEVLEQELKITVSVKALRCIDEAGGFDNYIINTHERTLDSKLAIDLKKLMTSVLKCKEEGIGMDQIREEVFPKPPKNGTVESTTAHFSDIHDSSAARQSADSPAAKMKFASSAVQKYASQKAFA